MSGGKPTRDLHSTDVPACWVRVTNLAPEISQARALSFHDQVRPATTIRRTEPRDMGITPMCQCRIRPDAFQPSLIGRGPDFDHLCRLSKVVDMPVVTPQGPQMMIYASFEAAGTEGTAEVQIKR